MFKKIMIENFRGLKKLSIEGLGTINLISGKNNVGKSTILESIFLFCEHAVPRSFSDIQGLRGYSLPFSDTYIWDLLFHDVNNNVPISIAGKYDDSDFALQYTKDDNFISATDELSQSDSQFPAPFIEFTKEKYSLKFDFKCDEYTETGHFLLDGKGTITAKVKTSAKSIEMRKMPVATFVNADVIARTLPPVAWIGKLQITGRIKKLVDILRVVEPGLEEVMSVSFQGGSQIYGRVGNAFLPLKLHGAGLNQLIFIVMAIMENPHGIILVDEIETGFHYSIYEDLWKLIAKLAKEYGCQIIATTHSYECIKAAHTSIDKMDMQNEFMFYRLAKDGENNFAYLMNSKLLDVAMRSNLEVR